MGNRVFPEAREEAAGRENLNPKGPPQNQQVFVFGHQEPGGGGHGAGQERVILRVAAAKAAERDRVIYPGFALDPLEPGLGVHTMDLSGETMSDGRVFLKDGRGDGEVEASSGP